MTEQKFDGIIIRRHRTIDQKSKDEAQDSFWGWKHIQLTAEDWCKELEKGVTIQPSLFVPKDDGNYSHSERYWKETYFVPTDGDNFIGVETDDKGNEANPSGIQPWTERNGLSKRFPQIIDYAYAISETVSSMSPEKEPQHRRYRIIFRVDKSITCGEHYRQILETLGEKFQIITPVKRHPGQPVFGNAREDTKEVYIYGNILKLSDYPFIEEQENINLNDNSEPNPRQSHSSQDGHGTHNATQRKYRNNLEGLIADAKLTTHPGGSTPGIRVDCPFNTEHAKDAFVMLDEQGFPTFKCHHNSCTGKGFNEMARVTGIEVPYNQDSKKRGRPSRAEQAQKVEVPPEINDKPAIMLQEIQPVDDEIVIAERSRDIVSDEVSQHLWRNGKVRLYRRGKELGSLRPSEDGLLFYPSSKASLGGDIARTVSLIKYGHDGKPTPIANAPGWLAEDILLNQDINDVPQIKVILTHPIF